MYVSGPDKTDVCLSLAKAEVCYRKHVLPEQSPHRRSLESIILSALNESIIEDAEKHPKKHAVSVAVGLIDAYLTKTNVPLAACVPCPALGWSINIYNMLLYSPVACGPRGPPADDPRGPSATGTWFDANPWL